MAGKSWGEDAARPPMRPGMMVAILLILSALSQADRGIISLLVDPITKSFGIDYFQFSLLQGSAFAFFYALFGLPCGMLADRWSRRYLIFGGVFFWSVATLACGIAASFHQLLLARFFVGAGEAALYPAAMSLISDVFPRHRLAGAIATFSIGTSLGGGISLGLGGFLLRFLGVHPLVLPFWGMLEPWQGLLVTLGLIGLPFAFLILLVPEPGRAAAGREDVSWAGLATFIGARRRFFLSMVTGYTLLGVLALASGSWVPQLLMHRYSFSPATAGLTFGLIAACANISGMLAAGKVLNILIRRGVTDAPLRLFLWVTPVTAAISVIGFLSHDPTIFIVCVLIGQFGFNIGGPAATAIQLVAASHVRGRIAALYGLIFNLVSISVGPSIVAALATYVLHDAGRVNEAVAITFVLVAPLAWLCFLAGLAPMRRAMATADQNAIAPA